MTVLFVASGKFLQMLEGKARAWVPFAKGGEFSRFYADVFLVVYWRDHGADIRGFDRALYTQ